MVQKMLFCFTNMSAEIIWHVLGYSFFTQYQILVIFCQFLLPLKASKIICAKDASTLTPKVLVKWTPGEKSNILGQVMKIT
jgi:hypothetical protein